MRELYGSDVSILTIIEVMNDVITRIKIMETEIGMLKEEVKSLRYTKEVENSLTNEGLNNDK